jgi:heme/copper-type cytochrome/quinol oxidase subunit 4
MDEKKKATFRLGVMVLIGLAVLTAIEYGVAFLPATATPTLFVVAIIKAWLILQYFMHVSTLWSEEGHE